MKMPTDKSWYGKMAAKEGDHEISAGRRLTSTINPTPEEIAEIERLQLEALAAWARDRISQQDAELERLRKENQSLTEAAIIGEYMWTPAELHEARKEAFFQGWEMSSTGGMEDTCADAWAFWSLMEDGRDEVEPDRYSRRDKAEETGHE